MASTILTAFASNLAIAESYISIILTGQLYKKSFDDQGLDRSVLSRSLEEGSTLLTALIPWTTTGVFYAATLGVPTIEYIQWSFLNWMNPLIGILFACLGIGMFRKKRTPKTTSQRSKSLCAFQHTPIVIHGLFRDLQPLVGHRLEFPVLLINTSKIFIARRFFLIIIQGVTLKLI